MKRIVYNSTEGGVDIKGTVKIPLCDYIKKYCSKAINKDKLASLMTLADDADELIERVIPLLQSDIDVLDIVISEIAWAGTDISLDVPRPANRIAKPGCFARRQMAGRRPSARRTSWPVPWRAAAW